MTPANRNTNASTRAMTIIAPYASVTVIQFKEEGESTCLFVCYMVQYILRCFRGENWLTEWSSWFNVSYLDAISPYPWRCQYLAPRQPQLHTISGTPWLPCRWWRSGFESGKHAQEHHPSSSNTVTTWIIEKVLELFLNNILTLLWAGRIT